MEETNEKKIYWFDLSVDMCASKPNEKREARRFLSRAHVYGHGKIEREDLNSWFSSMTWKCGISSSFIHFFLSTGLVQFVECKNQNFDSMASLPDWLAGLWVLWKKFVFKTNLLTHKEIVINQLSHKSTFNWIKMTHFLGSFQ